MNSHSKSYATNKISARMRTHIVCIKMQTCRKDADNKRLKRKKNAVENVQPE